MQDRLDLLLVTNMVEWLLPRQCASAAGIAKDYIFYSKNSMVASP